MSKKSGIAVRDNHELKGKKGYRYDFIGDVGATSYMVTVLSKEKLYYIDDVFGEAMKYNWNKTKRPGMVSLRLPGKVFFAKKLN